MEIPRIDMENREKYLDISPSEIRQMHYAIIKAHEIHLSRYGVIMPRSGDIPKNCSDEEYVTYLDAKELQLIFLYKYMKCFVHKDLVSEFVRKYVPNAALDQQVRHLGSQCYWYVLNRGTKVPDVNIKVPSGYHYLVSIETPNPKAVCEALKRAGRLMARDFEELKMAYSGKCATCGVEEKRKDTRNGEIVVLQQGHMNPRKPLTLDNTIPQCQYCNQTYRDYFQFNENGRVIAVNNPLILLKSPKDVRDEMIRVLLEERAVGH